jgi:arylsulfatase A-like enzyme
MLHRVWKFTLAWVAIAALVLQAAVPPALAQEILPHPPKPFSGKMGLTYKTSEPVKTQLKLPETFGIEDAPNVLLVLIDDVGFGQFGSFGGSIPTPTMDRVVKNGLQYTQFHTTALCSPTRAALLTGRNHHSVGNGTIAENWARAFPATPASFPMMPPPLPRCCRPTATPPPGLAKTTTCPTGKAAWLAPLTAGLAGLGFDYFYGFVGGDTDQFTPPWWKISPALEPPETNADGSPYHLSTDLADHAINYIRQEKAISPQKPFFVYLAPGATHAPHQVPQEWSTNSKVSSTWAGTSTAK